MIVTHLVTVYKCPQGDLERIEDGLFSVAADKTRSSGFTLQQGKSRLEIWSNFFDYAGAQAGKGYLEKLWSLHPWKHSQSH